MFLVVLVILVVLVFYLGELGGGVFCLF